MPSLPLSDPDIFVNYTFHLIYSTLSRPELKSPPAEQITIYRYRRQMLPLRPGYLHRYPLSPLAANLSFT